MMQEIEEKRAGTIFVKDVIKLAYGETGSRKEQSSLTAPVRKPAWVQILVAKLM